MRKNDDLMDVMIYALECCYKGVDLQLPHPKKMTTGEKIRSRVEDVLFAFVEVLINSGNARQHEYVFLECSFTNYKFNELVEKTKKQYIKNELEGRKV